VQTCRKAQESCNKQFALLATICRIPNLSFVFINVKAKFVTARWFAKMNAIGIFYVALALLSVLLICGIAKCWSISRRPATNAKCVMALSLVLVAWLIPFVWQGLSLLVPSLPLVSMVVSLISLGIVFAAAVLAVTGLREYSRQRNRYTQGKVQAIWTLVLSVLIGTLPIVTAVEMRWNVLGTRNPPVGARVMVFHELNFKFFAPGGRWAEVGTNDSEPNASVMLHSTRPEAYFLVIAQPMPWKNYSVDDLAEEATRNLGDTGAPVKVVYRWPIKLNQLEGLHLHSESERAGEKLYYEHRLFVTKDLTYQLIAWGHQRDRKKIAKEANDLAWCFEVIEYRPVPKPSISDIIRRHDLKQ
jgi:hypothetical protein